MFVSVNLQSCKFPYPNWKQNMFSVILNLIFVVVTSASVKSFWNSLDKVNYKWTTHIHNIFQCECLNWNAVLNTDFLGDWFLQTY